MTDESFQRGQQWLEQLLQRSGLSASVLVNHERSQSEGSCWLEIDESALSSEQIHHVIGDKGHTLDAVQYLCNTILNLGKSSDEQQAFTVELNGYRANRQAELQAMAETVAEHVRQTGEQQELTGLSSAERRQMHTLLKDQGDLETESVGREPDRRLVVRLVAD
jgi:spoIIIJ-associated protein